VPLPGGAALLHGLVGRANGLAGEPSRELDAGEEEHVGWVGEHAGVLQVPGEAAGAAA
jgi:hypothetical protein